LKPGFHFIGSRVETRRVSSYTAQLDSQLVQPHPGAHARVRSIRGSSGGSRRGARRRSGRCCRSSTRALWVYTGTRWRPSPPGRVALTPGCRLSYTDHTGCSQCVLSSIEPYGVLKCKRTRDKCHPRARAKTVLTAASGAGDGEPHARCKAPTLYLQLVDGIGAAERAVDDGYRREVPGEVAHLSPLAEDGGPHEQHASRRWRVGRIESHEAADLTVVPLVPHHLRGEDDGGAVQPHYGGHEAWGESRG
jgi:hypothetical protein